LRTMLCEIEVPFKTDTKSEDSAWNRQ